VDTPGYDDSNTPDSEILRELSTFLTETYSANVKLSGIIYLHRILDVRLGGHAMRNLRMFKKLVGQDNLASVVLATTFWGHEDREVAEGRERQLRDSDQFWGSMISRGSSMFRHDRDTSSGTDILNYLLNLAKRPTYAIQTEMVDKRLALDETAAGREVQSEVDKVRKEYEKKLEALREEREQALRARDEAFLKEMQEMRQMFENWLLKQEEERRKTQAQIDELWRQREAERDVARDQHQAQLIEMTKVYTQLFEKTSAEQASKQQKLEVEITQQKIQILEWKKKAETLTHRPKKDDGRKDDSARKERSRHAANWEQEASESRSEFPSQVKIGKSIASSMQLRR
jgi:hypothetical protein